MKPPSSYGLAHIGVTIQDIIKALGVVFGDIGTSPIYTLSAIFELIEPTAPNVIGAVSLIIWTLISLVTVQYAWLAMSLSIKGEGGTIVLSEILKSLLRSKWQIALVTLISFIGTSLFLGDGVITPAISILSAVEGIRYIPGLAAVTTRIILIIACCIAIILFSIQKQGVERVSRTFGPIMVIWFVTLFSSGLMSLMQQPWILLKALNPYYGIRCVIDNGFWGLFILAGVILCATGGESMYADMGHIGRRPIRQAWLLVFFALIVNYAGQAVFLLQNPNTHLVFFDMFSSQLPYLYVPFLLLTIMASVIASQALISGVFSVIYQGITTQIMPMMRIDYTSSRLHAQVYIGVVNWILMSAVLLIMLSFKHSANLAHAYGFAVSGLMLLTSIMMTWIFTLRRNRLKQMIAAGLLLINILFFGSSIVKLPYGGYWSIIIAIIPFALISLYVFGQRRMRAALQSIPVDVFVAEYGNRYKQATPLKGTGLFFVRNPRLIPPYVRQVMFDNRIMYEENIFVSVMQKEEPYGITSFFDEDLAPGLRVFEIHCGYMEVPNIDHILKNAGIYAQAIFFGLDVIVSRNVIWRIYALIKQLAPTFVQFHKLPHSKLHGVVTHVEM